MTNEEELANVENCKKEPSTMTLIRIAKALDCSPRDFFPKNDNYDNNNEKSEIKKEIIELLERL